MISKIRTSAVCVVTLASGSVFASEFRNVSALPALGEFSTRIAEDKLFEGNGRTLRCDLFFCVPGKKPVVAPKGFEAKQTLPAIVWQYSGLLPVNDYLKSATIHSLSSERQNRSWQGVQHTLHDGLLVEGAHHTDAKIAYAGAYAFAPRWSLVELVEVDEPVATYPDSTLYEIKSTVPPQQGMSVESYRSLSLQILQHPEEISLRDIQSVIDAIDESKTKALERASLGGIGGPVMAGNSPVVGNGSTIVTKADITDAETVEPVQSAAIFDSEVFSDIQNHPQGDSEVVSATKSPESAAGDSSVGIGSDQGFLSSISLPIANAIQRGVSNGAGASLSQAAGSVSEVAKSLSEQAVAAECHPTGSTAGSDKDKAVSKDTESTDQKEESGSTEEQSDSKDKVSDSKEQESDSDDEDSDSKKEKSDSNEEESGGKKAEVTSKEGETATKTPETATKTPETAGNESGCEPRLHGALGSEGNTVGKMIQPVAAEDSPDATTDPSSSSTTITKTTGGVIPVINRASPIPSGIIGGVLEKPLDTELKSESIAEATESVAVEAVEDEWAELRVNGVLPAELLQTAEIVKSPADEAPDQNVESSGIALDLSMLNPDGDLPEQIAPVQDEGSIEQVSQETTAEVSETNEKWVVLPDGSLILQSIKKGSAE